MQLLSPILRRRMSLVEVRLVKNPILITGVGGQVGGIGQKIVKNLIDKNLAVRALIHHEDAVLENELKSQGVEVVIGDLTNLQDVHDAIRDCQRLYFGMGISPKYLEATVNTAAVAKHYKIECLVNISQMTVSFMSINETTSSPQQKLHWLAEQVLNWSLLPVVHVRSTVFLEHPFFSQWAKKSIEESVEIRLPFGHSKTSPIAAREIKDYRRAAAQLKAATVITQGSPEKKIDKAHQIIDDFYDDLLKIFPELTMIKEEVVELLHRLNTEGLKDGHCDKIIPYGLARGFFPDDKAKEYMNWAAVEKARLEEKKVREEKAAQIRNERAAAAARIRVERSLGLKQVS